MQYKDKFDLGQKIYGEMPFRKPFTLSSAYPDRMEPFVEAIPFEGVVTQISSDGKVKKFRLTKAINIENESTKKSREEGTLLGDVGDTITVNDSPGWNIRALTS
ncbi:hypothetical protein ACE1CD_17565 [Aerosakkonema sp. BLCC-F183]|uniref:hypothetical protein n=1 Tax=Aerosakkonema sp. BLCC-F183 TaxID=3342834 RepID=UPI0035BA0EE9